MGFAGHGVGSQGGQVVGRGIIRLNVSGGGARGDGRREAHLQGARASSRGARCRSAEQRTLRQRAVRRHAAYFRERRSTLPAQQHLRRRICPTRSGDISPAARFARASFNAVGRSRLPTWSARKGGRVRFIGACPFRRAGKAKCARHRGAAGTALARLCPPYNSAARAIPHWRMPDYCAAASAACFCSSTKSYFTS